MLQRLVNFLEVLPILLYGGGLFAIVLLGFLATNNSCWGY